MIHLELFTGLCLFVNTFFITFMLTYKEKISLVILCQSKKFKKIESDYFTENFEVKKKTKMKNIHLHIFYLLFLRVNIRV